MATTAVPTDFVTGKLLGKGGFGKVFLCHNKKDQSLKYALKEIDLSEASSAVRSKALQEAKLLSKFKHKHIVSYVDSFNKGTSLCIVTEYCSGGDLLKLLQRKYRQNISENKIVNWFYQICTALEYLHTNNTLHRDIKPQNVFLTGTNEDAKLGDFGLAKVLESYSANAETFCGTLVYISPEIWKGEPYGRKSDIWSLGILVYEMSTSRKPFNGEFREVMRRVKVDKPTPIPRDEYTPQLCDLVDRMLEKEPSKRPSAKDLIEIMDTTMFITRKRVEKINDMVVSQMNGFEKTLLKSIEEKYSVKIRVDLAKNNIFMSGIENDMHNAKDDMYDVFRKVNYRRAREWKAAQYKEIVQWYLMDIDNVLIEYPDILNMELEKAYRKGSMNTPEVEFKDDKGNAYVIVLKDMKEYLKNNRSDDVYVLRREKVQGYNGNVEPPTEWNEQGCHDLVTVKLPYTSPEYKKVEEKFLKSVFGGKPEWVNQFNKQTFKVTEIERVQNFSLYQMYAAKKAHIEKENLIGIELEKELWHGTPDSYVDGIKLFGFNRGYCKDNSLEGNWGEGVHFATDASYAARGWLSKENAGGEHKIFLSKVLTGVSCKGTKGMRILSYRCDGSNMKYHSATDDCIPVEEYVIFNDAQAYPQYCITFKY